MATKIDRRDYSNVFFEQFALMPEPEQDSVIRTLQAIRRAVATVRRNGGPDIPLLAGPVEE
jgi:hypothetical protein